MIRFTVVDRLVRLVMDALSPRERVYMLYLLGIRSGHCPGSCYNIRGSEDRLERLLREQDSAITVVENVYYLPHAQYEVDADRSQAVTSSTSLHMIVSTAAHSIRLMTPAATLSEAHLHNSPTQRVRDYYREDPVDTPAWPARWQEGVQEQATTESDAVANIIESRVWAEVGTQPATAAQSEQGASAEGASVDMADPLGFERGWRRAGWTERDEQLFRRIQDARIAEEGRMRGASISTQRSTSAPYTFQRLNTDYNHRRR